MYTLGNLPYASSIIGTAAQTYFDSKQIEYIALNFVMSSMLYECTATLMASPKFLCFPWPCILTSAVGKCCVCEAGKVHPVETSPFTAEVRVEGSG